MCIITVFLYVVVGIKIGSDLDVYYNCISVCCSGNQDQFGP